MAKRMIAPEWLVGKTARTYFYSRVKELPPLDYGQRELLAKAAAEHESYISLQLLLEDISKMPEGIFVAGSTGNLVPHPALAMQQKHGEALRKWETQLRLSLKTGEPEPIVVDELDSLIGDE